MFVCCVTTKGLSRRWLWEGREWSCSRSLIEISLMKIWNIKIIKIFSSIEICFEIILVRFLFSFLSVGLEETKEMTLKGTEVSNYQKTSTNKTKIWRISENQLKFQIINFDKLIKISESNSVWTFLLSSIRRNHWATVAYYIARCSIIFQLLTPSKNLPTQTKSRFHSIWYLN